MKNYIRTICYLLMVGFTQFKCAKAQTDTGDIKLVKTTEIINKYHFKSEAKQSILKMTGVIGQSVLYYSRSKNDGRVNFSILNESTFDFSDVYQKLNLSGRMFGNFCGKDSLLFYTKSFYKSSDDYGYNYLILNSGSINIVLDSIYNADKPIHCNFSLDGKYLLINTLSTLSDHYNPQQDDQIIMYFLDEFKISGKAGKQSIPCMHCADAHLVGENLFFTKANRPDDFSVGFEWTDIYVAPWQNLKDSVRIAAYSDILAVSPDGKYMLIERLFDLPNGPRAILDVVNKRYQLLLGRDYSKATGFYSYAKQKFAFHFKDRIVYVDFPEDYPFDALRKGNPDIPNWTEKSFYEQYRHAPFDE